MGDRFKSHIQIQYHMWAVPINHVFTQNSGVMSLFWKEYDLPVDSLSISGVLTLHVIMVIFSGMNILKLTVCMQIRTGDGVYYMYRYIANTWEQPVSIR